MDERDARLDEPVMAKLSCGCIHSLRADHCATHSSLGTLAGEPEPFIKEIIALLPVFAAPVSGHLLRWPEA